MKHIKSFNEGKENDPMEKITKAFSKMGVNVTEDGIIKPTSKFGKMLCKMAVSDGHFEDLGNGEFKLK